jgi:hypothetical protein
MTIMKETPAPEVVVEVQPLVRLLQRRPAHSNPMLAAVDTSFDEAGLFEHL